MVNRSSLSPRHVAIVMDGNGRWAKQRNLPRVAGHREGAKAVRKAIEFSAKHKIEILTLFALSVENKNFRPSQEVKFLMSLFLDSLRDNTEELHKNNIKIRIIGDRSQFNASLQQQISYSENLTAHNTGLTLVIAINYSGRWDIVQATQRITQQVMTGVLAMENITEDTMQRFFCLHELPEPDLLIRTSGEQRISNFMLWQLAYTELYFPTVFWPDFDERVFTEALAFFQTRQRRFGFVEERVSV